MTAKISASRGVASLGASLLLRITLGGGAMLSALSGTVQADPAPVEASEVTINPTTGAPALTLQGPAFDSASAANYGLVLKYHDSTSTDPKASSVLRILRPTGEYQWQFSTSAGDGRLAMVLGDDHSLTLTDPANPSDLNSAIVLRPGNSPGAGVFWNDQKLATVQMVNAGFVPVLNNGDVSIGASLTLGGRLLLPATTNANTGVAYIGTSTLFHTYGQENTFFGKNAGNFSIDASSAAVVGFGEGTLSHFHTGNANVAIGAYALSLATSATRDVAIGAGALANADGLSSVIAIGYNAGWNLSASDNVMVGDVSGWFIHGSGNVALGNGAMYGGGATDNVAIGGTSMYYATDAYANTAVGAHALQYISAGYKNVIIGAYSGNSTATGSHNIIVGYNINLPDSAASNQMSIGNLLFATGLDGENTTVSSGKIGIGTATPATKLDVAGDATVRGVLHVAPGGDISMGDFTAGTNPLPPQP